MTKCLAALLVTLSISPLALAQRGGRGGHGGFGGRAGGFSGGGRISSGRSFGGYYGSGRIVSPGRYYSPGRVYGPSYRPAPAPRYGYGYGYGYRPVRPYYPRLAYRPYYSGYYGGWGLGLWSTPLWWNDPYWFDSYWYGPSGNYAPNYPVIRYGGPQAAAPPPQPAPSVNYDDGRWHKFDEVPPRY